MSLTVKLQYTDFCPFSGRYTIPYVHKGPLQFIAIKMTLSKDFVSHSQAASWPSIFMLVDVSVYKGGTALLPLKSIVGQWKNDPASLK